jgi:hypothetical protein
VFCGVGRGSTSRVTLVPLTAVGSPLLVVASMAVFASFVSWISFVVILDLSAPHINAATFVIRLLLG